MSMVNSLIYQNAEKSEYQEIRIPRNQNTKKSNYSTQRYRLNFFNFLTP